MSNAMIRALLIAQLWSLQILALARLGGVASCAPWGNGLEKTAWRGHSLPVDRPEEVEARQCENWVVNIGISTGQKTAASACDKPNVARWPE